MGDGWLDKLKRSPVAQLLLAITFLTSGLILNLIQCILYTCVRPFSKHVFRKLNYYPTYSLHSQLVFMAEWWGDLDVVTYARTEDVPLFGKEHAFCIMNHRYEIDWLVGFVYCERIGLLGNCKTYAKKSIQYVPLLGWAWKFAESVFLDRSWDKDKEIIGRQVTELANYPDPMWLLLTAEGTRMTPAKLEASQKFAAARGLPHLKHHLTPRSKGFSYSVPYLRGKVDAIYNVQLAFRDSGGAPYPLTHSPHLFVVTAKRRTSDRATACCCSVPGAMEPTVHNLMMARRVEAHFYIERIPMERVPGGEEELTQWLQRLYVTKDRMADSFLNTGSFFAESGVAAVPTHRLARRPYSLVNTLGWAAVVLVPMMYYLARLLLSGSTLYFAIGAGIIAVFSLGMSQLVNQTKISGGSKYGATKNAAAAATAKQD